VTEANKNNHNTSNTSLFFTSKTRIT